MSLSALAGLAWRLLAREWRAGEVAALAFALVVATASLATVGAFTDRVDRALAQEANRLLGADLVLVADHPVPPAFIAEARRRGLAVSHTLSFPSMAGSAGGVRLVEVKAVAPGYPLRGRLELDRASPPEGVPAPGTAWAERGLLDALGLAVGDGVDLGACRFTLAAVIEREPDRAGAFFAFAPRLMIAAGDLPATGLLQEGSRATHRLLVAGEARAVAGFHAWASPRLDRGERLENATDNRPELRSALERARTFLGLAALVAAALASVAVALGARRFGERRWDAAALLRCFGARQRDMVALFTLQLVFLGLLAGGGGALLGYGAQEVLARWLGTLVMDGSLPAPTLRPALVAVLAGVGLLAGFALPALLRLAGVPALRVLRRDLGGTSGGWLAYLPGVALLAALVGGQAGEGRLALHAVGGFLLLGLGAAVLARGLVLLSRPLAARSRGAWRFGLANMGRRGGESVWQVAAFGVGLMALLTLTVVRNDLLQGWERSLPPDAPNRFVINLQPDQAEDFRAFFPARGLAEPALEPMVRGRLMAINGRPVKRADYRDDRARRLAEREFNLSWRAAPPAHNVLAAGRWWAPEEGALSVEEGIATTLGIRLGDRLTWQVAGNTFTAPVANLRRVAWDSFRVNFFVIASPPLLAEQPASLVTSFYLPPGREGLATELVRAFPNLTVIDVGAVLGEVRAMMERVSVAVQFVFGFTLLAGVAVLYAAVTASLDERRREAALLRTLGASGRQVRLAQLAEFAGAGLLAGLLGALGAWGLGYFVAERFLDLPYAFDPWLWVAGALAGSLGVTGAGFLATWRVLRGVPGDVLWEG